MGWAAYINGRLVFGRGRAVWAIDEQRALTTRLLTEAQRIHADSIYVQQRLEPEHFATLYISAIAARDHMPASPDPFRHAVSPVRLLGATDRTAIAIYNGMVASSLAFENGLPLSSRRIVTALASSAPRFLRHPQDSEALTRSDIRSLLPGFLLPGAARRPLLRNWETELRRLEAIQ